MTVDGGVVENNFMRMADQDHVTRSDQSGSEKGVMSTHWEYSIPPSRISIVIQSRAGQLPQ